MTIVVAIKGGHNSPQKFIVGVPRILNSAEMTPVMIMFVSKYMYSIL